MRAFPVPQGGSGGVSQDEVNTTAEAFASVFDARRVAGGGVLGGSPGLTTHLVLQTTDGKVQIGSLGDGNVVEIYTTGADFLAGNIKSRLFLSDGEIHVEDGLSAGSVITTSRGIGGASGNQDGSNESPMPLAPQAFAGRQFFLFAFRNSSGGDGTNRGEVYAGTFAVAARVWLYNGAGTTIVDGPYDLPPYTVQTMLTNANSEFQVVATQDVATGVAAAMSVTAPRFYDMRLVPPPATELMGQNRNGRLSALYDNTIFYWYRRNGEMGRVTVSPGSPVSIYTGTINELGDVFDINSAPTPATGGTFTLTVNGETTTSIPFDATSAQVAAALAGLASYGADDFKVYMARGDQMSDANAYMRIECLGALERVSGSPSIDTAGLVGAPHGLNVKQQGNQAANAGSDADYGSNGATLWLGTGPGSCLSGADGQGLEASYFQDPATFAQEIALPLAAQTSNSGRTSGVAFWSRYEGQVKLYREDGSLYATLNLTRSNAVNHAYDQLHPAAASIVFNTANGEWPGGKAVANVPVGCVLNTEENQNIVPNGIRTDADEIVMLGVTKDATRAEFRADEARINRRRVIAEDGTESWGQT
ncbi:MAG: hypothetical protein AAF141_05580 [Pseudomonadota bacterium]